MNAGGCHRGKLMSGILGQLDARIAAALLSILMLASWRGGVWLARGRTGADEPGDKFEEAGMGLLALLLAFTFAMSLQKYDRRREMLVADTNAIGDFYTCASLLEEPVRSKLQGVIREYAMLRLTTARAGRGISEKALEGVMAQFDEMQSRMTGLVVEALHLGTPIAVPLTNTLNEVTSSQTSRLAAIRDRLPVAILSLLSLSAILSTALIGRQQGASGRVRFAGVFCYVLVVGLVVWVTLDLNQPGRSMTRVSQEPLERLIASIGH